MTQQQSRKRADLCDDVDFLANPPVCSDPWNRTDRTYHNVTLTYSQYNVPVIPQPYFYQPTPLHLAPHAFSGHGIHPAPLYPVALPTLRHAVRNSPCISTTADEDISQIQPPKKKPRLSKTIELSGLYNVSGRLSQCGSSLRYSVSKEELLRRVNEPEGMNICALSHLLRQPKLKNFSKDLRQQLLDVGVEVKNTSKTRSTTSNVFETLVEGESLKAAKDLNDIVTTEYPIEQMASHFASVSGGQTLEQRRTMLRSAVDFLNQLEEAFSKSNVPLSDSPYVCRSDEPAYNDGMRRVSALTHGFAIKNQETWVRQFKEIAITALSLM